MAAGLLILRVVLGLTMSVHGAQKALGWFGGNGLKALATGMGNRGFRPGWLFAGLVGGAELGGGMFFAAGLLTPFTVGVLVATMVVAIVTAHWKNGFFNGKRGYEYNLVLIAGFVAIGFTGAGAWSLDGALGWELGGYSWGIFATALGMAGAGAALLVRRAVPEPAAAAAAAAAAATTPTLATTPASGGGTAA